MVKNKPLFITDQARKLHRGQVRLFAESNVLELIFKRRINPPKVRNRKYKVKGFFRKIFKKVFQRKPPGTAIRRILCTADWKYLRDNKRVFNYKTPRGPKRSDGW